MTLSRRSLITGLISLVAAPAIVRVSSLMPIKALESEAFEWSPFHTIVPIDPILYAELQVITRKAFLPRFPVIQVYHSSPVLRALMEHAK